MFAVPPNRLRIVCAERNARKLTARPGSAAIGEGREKSGIDLPIRHPDNLLYPLPADLQFAANLREVHGFRQLENSHPASPEGRHLSFGHVAYYLHP